MTEKKQFCPLIKDDCKEVECAWYRHQGGTAKHSGCVMWRIQGSLYMIAASIPGDDDY